MYVYHIFGMLTRENMLKMSEDTSHMFDDVEGLITRYGLSNVNDEITSGLFFCESLESAEAVKRKVHEVVEKYDEYVGYTTEFIYKIVDSMNYK